MLTILWRASIEGAVVVAAVWALARTVRSLSPAARTLLWWFAAAKFVIALAWIEPIVLPILPPSAPSPVAIVMPAAAPTAAAPSRSVPSGRFDILASPARENWRGAVVLLWAAGLIIAAAIGVRRWRRMSAIIRRAQPVDPELRDRAIELADRIQLPRVPEIRRSDEIETPLAAGLLHPVILLPAARFSALTERQQQMALCHELAHIKRADLWLGCIPALAERVFFFHPLARVAAREYALCREAACDAAVLDALDAAPQEYGRLLLDLGVSRRPAGLVAAGTAWSISSLKRRIAMLQQSANRSLSRRLIAGFTITLGLLSILPLQVGARPLAPRHEPASANPAQNPTTSDAAKSRDQSRSKDSLTYVFFVDDDHTTMSGSTSDIARARRFKTPGTPLLWARLEGREYVIRDRATLGAIESALIPLNEIGGRQGAVGGRQGEIGALQGEIGKNMGQIGAEQAAIGGRQSRVANRQARLAAQESARTRTDSGRETVERDRRLLDDEMRDLDREMRLLDDKMRELDKAMRELDDKMRQQDREMRALDQEMQVAVRRAEKELRAHLERAIQTGLADIVRD